MTFSVEASCPRTWARSGRLATAHGVVPTPAFAPVGTQATVKGLTPDDLDCIGARIVLSNTYHLYLRPGVDIIHELGGLHRFMGWTGPLLTDSGGYQVFSLAHLQRVTDEGVLFRSHIDGSEHFLTPERCIELQEMVGADIIMVLDECPPYGEDEEATRRATERTHRWAARCQASHSQENQALYAVVQGGASVEVRRRSAQQLSSMGFDGYAIGGLSLGEPKETTNEMVEETVPFLPTNRPRYLMGVGAPDDILEGISRGIDLFDSALPTRMARNGGLFTRKRRISIRNAAFRHRDEPIDADCDCYTCTHFSAAYLHHLFKCEELLAYRLGTIHNLRFMLRLMAESRSRIAEGTFASFKESFVGQYKPADEETRRVQRGKWMKTRAAKP